jgi:hypothetical protein
MNAIKSRGRLLLSGLLGAVLLAGGLLGINGTRPPNAGAGGRGAGDFAGKV